MIESFRKNIWGNWRETSKNGSQFLQKRNLKREIVLELKIVDLILFLSHMTVTNFHITWYNVIYQLHIISHGYMIMCYTEEHRRFQNNDVILYINNM